MCPFGACQMVTPKQGLRVVRDFLDYDFLLHEVCLGRLNKVEFGLEVAVGNGFTPLCSQAPDDLPHYILVEANSANVIRQALWHVEEVAKFGPYRVQSFQLRPEGFCYRRSFPRPEEEELRESQLSK